MDFNLLQNANKAVKNEPVVSPVKAAEPPASTHSDPEEPVSPAQVLSQSQAKARQKSSKSTKAHKTLKPPKTPKAPKTPKVKEGGKKKAKKFKESSLPLKASSFAALESHAKDILSKMDDSKKAKVGGETSSVASASRTAVFSFLFLFVLLLLLQVVKNLLSMSAKEIPKQNNMEKFEIREQSKNKTEAKWKYKVRTVLVLSWSCPGPGTVRVLVPASVAPVAPSGSTFSALFVSRTANRILY